MSLYALNSLEPGIRGIHAPKQITVKRVDPETKAETIVAVIEERADGTVTVSPGSRVLVIGMA